MRHWGVNPSVSFILEEMRAGKIIIEGLPPGTQNSEMQNAQVPAANNVQIKKNDPAIMKSAQAQAQAQAAVANQVLDQRAKVSPTMPTAQQAQAMGQQPQGTKTNPQDAQKQAQVLKSLAKDSDKDNDGQVDADENGQQQKKPYQNPTVVKQPGQARPANEEALDMLSMVLESENGKLVTMMAPSYLVARGDIDMAADALKAIGEALMLGVMTEQTATKVLQQRFDTSMHTALNEFVVFAGGIDQILEEIEITEGLKTKMAAGALATLLAAGGMNLGSSKPQMITEPGSKRQTQSQVEKKPTPQKPATNEKEIARLAALLAPTGQRSLGGPGQQRTNTIADLRVAFQRVTNGRWTPEDAVKRLDGRYDMGEKVRKTLLQAMSNMVSEEIAPTKNATPGSENPDEETNHNDDEDKKMMRKRGRRLADMGGYQGPAPARMGKDTTDNESGERHREVNDGILTSEAHTELLDEIFGD